MKGYAMMLLTTFLAMNLLALAVNGARNTRSTTATGEHYQINLRRGAATNRRNLDSTSDNGNIKVLVQYKTQQGKEAAKTKASTISCESQRFNIVAIEIEPSSLLDLQQNDDVERVELDRYVHAILPIERDETIRTQSNRKKCKYEQKPPTRPSRRLEEQVPWGIQAIQTDQVSVVPFANQIKVCIVDTGVGTNISE
jgi:hypothetical protein